ncbi:hypothetical protein B0H19DRAFT_1188081 [Mycena capillaripes]|nr:hypothetical protein B0H19DRAFT_1188081 [Mycena capillaripes]
MTSIPNELIEVIVRDVGDTTSLKSCGLVGSAFRYPSQRILLQSLTLKADPPNYSAVRLFLDESPHVATYIITLYIWPPTATTPVSEVESFVQILDRPGLDNVRSCTLGPIRYEYLPQDWTQVTAQVSSAVLGFLGRQSLRQLHIRAISYLSIPAFLRLLRAAPKIIFSNVHVTEAPADLSVLDLDRLEGPALKSLGLEYGIDAICELFTRPQYAFLTVALRDLQVAVPSSDASCLGLMCSVARTLEYISLIDAVALSAADRSVSIYQLPPFPALRRLKLLLVLRGFESWLPELLSHIMETSIGLMDITLWFYPLNPPSSSVPQNKINGGLLSALDAALAAHPASPTITWELDVDDAEDLTTFAALLREAMPQMQDKGRHSFNTYVWSIAA